MLPGGEESNTSPRELTLFTATLCIGRPYSSTGFCEIAGLPRPPARLTGWEANVVRAFDTVEPLPLPADAITLQTGQTRKGRVMQIIGNEFLL